MKPMKIVSLEQLTVGLRPEEVREAREWAERLSSGIALRRLRRILGRRRAAMAVGHLIQALAAVAQAAGIKVEIIVRHGGEEIHL